MAKSGRDIISGVVGGAAALATSVISSGLETISSAVSSIFNFDNPSTLDPVHRFVERSCPDMANTHGMDMGIVLGRKPERKPLVLPGISSIPVGVDEMDLAVVASVPGIIRADITFSSSTPRGTVFAQWPVNPRYCWTDWPSSVPAGVAAVRCYPTPAAHVSLPFALWRGTMRYKIYFICSSFHTARVKIAFVPRANAAKVLPTAVNSMSQLVDVQGPTSVEFSVPFLWHLPYAEQSIGAITMAMVNPPPTVGDVANPPVFCIVYAAMGADASFQDISPFRYIPDTEVVIAAAEACPREDFAKAFPAIAPGCVSVMEGDTFFPDHYTKVSDLTRAFQAWPYVSAHDPANYMPSPGTMYSLLPQLAGPPWLLDPGGTPNPTNQLQFQQSESANIGLVQQWNNLLPFDSSSQEYIYVTTGPAAATAVQGDAAEVGAFCYRRWTLADHFAQLYRFQRGGARLRWYGNPEARVTYTVPLAGASYAYNAAVEEGTATEAAMTQLIPSGKPQTSAATTTWESTRVDAVPFQIELPAAITTAVAATAAPLGLCKLEVDVPWRGQQPFCTTGTPGTFCPLPAVDGPIVASFDVGQNLFATFRYDTLGDGGTTAPTGQQYRAMSDDHRFYFICGPSPCYLLQEPMQGGTQVTQQILGAYATEPAPTAQYHTLLWNSVFCTGASAS